MNHTRFSAFTAKGHEPTSEEVGDVLGPAALAWNELRRVLIHIYEPVEEHWLYGGVHYGWSLRLRRKKKPIVYLCPREGDFLASLALNEKARDLALEADLPEWVKSILQTAHKYAEGYAIRLVVSDLAQVEDVLRLLSLKHQNGNHNHNMSVKIPT